MKRIPLRLLIALVLSVITLVLVWWLYFYEPGEAAPDTAMLHKKAEAGHMNSRHALGEAYRLGRGEDIDMVQAYLWHKKAALQGHTGSQYMLGFILERGNGVRQNLGRAFEWYSLASKMSDNRDAEFAMAQMYFHGRGVSQDFAEAFILYKKVAFKGHRIAQYLLGAMYEDGWAEKRNLIKAYKWYTLALPGRQAAIALNPLYDPRQALDRLIPRMTNYQVRRGDLAVQEWRIEHDDPFK